MVRSDSQERVILWWSAAVATVAVCTVFVASMSKTDLLQWFIDTGSFLPLVGVVLLVRTMVGIITFVVLERPPETRSLSAIFLRDNWLRERMKLSQPRALFAFGASLTFFKLAMLVAIGFAAICSWLRMMSLGQTVSVFVLGSLLWVIYQALGTTILLLRQIAMPMNQQA